MIFEESNPVHWYCVRSQPKHEHIAAANLARHLGLEVYAPSLRMRRPRPTGPVWVREALFPGYLFARFSLPTVLDKVRYTSGVKSLVQFGGRYPVVSEEVLEQIRTSLQGEEILEHTSEFVVGDEVEILDGPLRGLSAVVQRYLPARQRVQVLLEFLGQSTSVDLSVGQLSSTRPYPEQVLVNSVIGV
jgi:transcriptional antiterminator RfaH